ncbi:hypothetical protein [Alkalibacillus silvisoli]|uniref:Endolytic transglycosylase MltG n=1 Tax=Alkalibacillus silvisoli TaxID=392823 RepID=A0ABP3JLM5_9BACI
MSFSLGILLTTLIVGVTYFFESHEQHSSFEVDTEHLEFTEEQARELIESSEKVMVTEEELNQYKDYEQENISLKEQIKQYEDELENQEGQIGHDIFTLEIESGMSTRNIADLLKEENIIEDATEFVEFLTENDYSRQIQVGQYVVTSAMSDQQIAITITN